MIFFCDFFEILVLASDFFVRFSSKFSVICDFWCFLYGIFCDFVIFVCDFFVISRELYEKIGDLSLEFNHIISVDIGPRSYASDSE